MQEVLVNIPDISHVQPLSKIHTLQLSLWFNTQQMCQTCGIDSNGPCFICTVILMKEAECILFWLDMPGIAQFKVTY